ncbi:hypothetical protein [Actinomadura macrotermitis]|uniref:DoxX family protein n=1 Tax=Actinomadura macrotermitis TaxID=2585200 RepID=A0A7K0C444_9ACTN|nr:hypothetical protein [Actinomadura macrotermitis]MQY08211.1 hypothetical protein [Actinomadura macrotermitis]
MRFPVRAHQMPARIAAGLFILNSGMTKSKADKQTAEGLHGMAGGTYPFLKSQDPERFTALLAKAEMALGAALLLPMVPSLAAGAALTAFGGGLIGMYLKTPGMHEEGSVRPTQQGLAVAKDIWLVGIGLSLVTEELGRRKR